MTRCLKGLDVVIGQTPPAPQGYGLPFGWQGMNPAWWQWYYGSGQPDGEIEDVMARMEQIRQIDSRDIQIRGDAGSRCLAGLDVCIGAERQLVGAFDISAWQKQMNKLKVIPVGVAQVLLSAGQAVINWAIVTAKAIDIAKSGIPFAEKLPRAANRESVMWKLKWHAERLTESAPTALSAYLNYQSDKEAFKKAGTRLAAPYAHGDDLKKWVMEAFIEANAVEDGASAVIDQWNKMWSEIGAALAALPAEVAKKAGDVAKEVAWYAKWTIWLAVLAGAVALGFMGWGVGAGIKARIATSTKRST